jgi:hypothetical protein
MKTLAELGIRIDATKRGNQLALCPQCSHLRKKKHIKCLSVIRDDRGAAFFCHHCGFKGGVLDEGETGRAGMVRDEGHQPSDFGASARRARYAFSGKT